MLAAANTPAARRVNLLVVLDHELGHVIGQPDNSITGDLMNIALGDGTCRSPSATDMAIITQVSTAATPAASIAIAPAGPATPLDHSEVDSASPTTGSGAAPIAAGVIVPLDTGNGQSRSTASSNANASRAAVESLLASAVGVGDDGE